MARIGVRLVLLLFALLSLIAITSVFAGKLLASPILTFVSNAHGNRDIFLLDTRTQLLHNFTNTTDIDEWSFVWSQAGERILYTIPSGVGDDFFVMDANGGHKQQVNVSTQQAFNITWSPSAQELAYFSSYQNTSELYLISLVDNTTINLTNTPNISEGFPEWSPDGKNLLFRMSNDLYLRDMQSGHIQQLTATGNAEEFPVWSPDSSSIVFQRLDEMTGIRHVFLMTLPDGGIKQLANLDSPRLQPVSWSPDSTSLVLALNSQEIIIYDTESDKVHAITDGSQRASYPVWSPDGRYIAYVADRAIQIYDLRREQILKLDITFPLQLQPPLVWLP